MSNTLVTLVIVSAGKSECLEALLSSAAQQTHSNRQVCLIDNSPGAGLSQRLGPAFPGISFFPGREPSSYCRALNQGIDAARGEFVLCLNDDIVLEPDFIERGLRGFSVDEKIGMVSGKIMRADKRTIDSCGLFLSIWYSPKERGYGEADNGRYEKEGYIFGVNGAAAFYRRQMLEDIKLAGGYFDPDYVIFYEDLDLAWRGQKKGWKAYYVPGAVAYHVRGASVRIEKGVGMPFARRYVPDELYAHLFKNRYFTLARNANPGGFLAHLPCIALYDALLWMHALACRPRLALNALLRPRALGNFYKKLKRIVSERTNTAV